MSKVIHFAFSSVNSPISAAWCGSVPADSKGRLSVWPGAVTCRQCKRLLVMTRHPSNNSTPSSSNG